MQPPVLIYHKVMPHWEPGVTWTTPTRFFNQMRRIHEDGWRTVLPSNDGNGCEPGDGAGDKRFTIVFDDGYDAIHRYAFPILAQFDFKATVFIPSGYIGRHNNWDYNFLGRRFKHLNRFQIYELLRNGWSLGSHSVNHLALTSLPTDALEWELLQSRIRLEDGFGVPVRWISFPFGRYDARVTAAAMRCGYVGAVAPTLRNAGETEGIPVWRGDAVYLWDTARMVSSRLRCTGSHRIGRSVRRGVNMLSGGTIMWRKLFPAHRPR